MSTCISCGNTLFPDSDLEWGYCMNLLCGMYNKRQRNSAITPAAVPAKETQELPKEENADNKISGKTKLQSK